MTPWPRILEYLIRKKLNLSHSFFKSNVLVVVHNEHRNQNSTVLAFRQKMTMSLQIIFFYGQYQDFKRCLCTKLCHFPNRV